MEIKKGRRGLSPIQLHDPEITDQEKNANKYNDNFATAGRKLAENIWEVDSKLPLLLLLSAYIFRTDFARTEETISQLQDETSSSFQEIRD